MRRFPGAQLVMAAPYQKAHGIISESHVQRKDRSYNQPNDDQIPPPRACHAAAGNRPGRAARPAARPRPGPGRRPARRRRRRASAPCANLRRGAARDPGARGRHAAAPGPGQRRGGAGTADRADQPDQRRLRPGRPALRRGLRRTAARPARSARGGRGGHRGHLRHGDQRRLPHRHGLGQPGALCAAPPCPDPLYRLDRQRHPRYRHHGGGRMERSDRRPRSALYPSQGRRCPGPGGRPRWHLLCLHGGGQLQQTPTCSTSSAPPISTWPSERGCVLRIAPEQDGPRSTPPKCSALPGGDALQRRRRPLRHRPGGRHLAHQRPSLRRAAPHPGRAALRLPAPPSAPSPARHR